MPRGYRLLGAAALGIVVIIALATGAYFGALNATYNSNHSKESAYSTGKPKQGNPSQIDRDRAGLPDFVERIASAPDPKNADEREKRDLAAQEASALWSFWMLFATAFSAVITTIGTGILLWQIMLTRKAVQDTGEATKEMRESNRIARNALLMQNRALILVESVNMIRFQCINTIFEGVQCECIFINLEIIFVNRGNCATSDFYGDAKVIGTADSLLKEVLEFRLVSSRQDCLVPGEVRRQHFSAVLPLSPTFTEYDSNEPMPSRGSIGINLAVGASYKTLEDTQSRETRQWWAIGPPGDFNSIGFYSFADLKSGNPLPSRALLQRSLKIT